MKESRVLLFSSLLLFGFAPANAATTTNVFVGERGNNQIPYRLRLPNGHDTSTTDFPLVLRLHGSGGRGDDLGIGLGPSAGRANEMITIAPQAPLNTSWNDPVIQSYVKSVIDFESATLRVDPNRIYVQGYSMGGYGTYSMAQAYPNTFAAASAVAGGGSTVGSQPTDVAFWSFHGDLDTVVLPEWGQATVDTLRADGAYVRYTRYPDYTHGQSTDPTETQNITQKSRSSFYYSWLFSQELGTPHNYELGVDDGEGVIVSDFIEPGTDYVITARPPDTAIGEIFTGWTSTSGTPVPHTTTSPVGGDPGVFGDPNALSTTFTMPSYDSIVTANYTIVIPEPSAFALLAFSFLSLGLFRSRSKRDHSERI